MFGRPSSNQVLQVKRCICPWFFLPTRRIDAISNSSIRYRVRAWRYHRRRLESRVSSGGVCSSRKGDRNQRTWTNMEEVTLIAALKELIAQGWKSDNCFKAGYLLRLESALQKQFLACGIKAMPHINSRLASWKKWYNSLSQMLSRSGVSFNSRGNHMVECEDDQWEKIVKVDPNARLMRYKSWPYYTNWKEMFRKDRATGENAQNIYKAYTALRDPDPVNHDGMPLGDREATYENDTHKDLYDGVSQSTRDVPQSSQRVGGKKRRIQKELQQVCELLADMNKSTNARLEHLANRIGYEFDMGKARQEVLDQLREIDGLSLKEKFKVCELVAFKAERLNIWRAMKLEARAQYVQHLLGDHA